METSTILMKTNRIRICNKNQLSNLVNHILRNYKPETRQAKEDFFPEESKNNILIGSDYKLKTFNDNWFDEVQETSNDFKQALNQSLVDADNETLEVSLSRSEKDKTIKSINYFSKLKNIDPEIENSLLSIMTTCQEYKNQDPKNKDYSIFDKEELNETLAFYQQPPSGIKIKSLNAKVKNLTQIIENVDLMKVDNKRKATASSRAIGFEETLIKIPKHNNKSIEDLDMIKIYKGFHEKHFSNFDMLGGAFHKDERTKKGNTQDDHLHIIKSGFNSKTKKFDLPDYTHQLGLELAKKQGIKFEADNKKYNETTEELRSLASEALQTEFYSFTNKFLEKNEYNFRIEKKELTPEEKELRAFLKEQSTLPKSQRVQNMHSYFEEKALENIKKVNKINKIKNEKILETNQVIKIKNKNIVENKEIKKEIIEHKEIKNNLNKVINDMTEWLKVGLKDWYSNLIDGVLNKDKEKIEAAAKKHNEIEDENKLVSEVLDQKIETFDDYVKEPYKRKRNSNRNRNRP